MSQGALGGVGGRCEPGKGEGAGVDLFCPQLNEPQDAL